MIKLMYIYFSVLFIYVLTSVPCDWSSMMMMPQQVTNNVIKVYINFFAFSGKQTIERKHMHNHSDETRALIQAVPE